MRTKQKYIKLLVSLGFQNSVQTGQLNLLFHIFANLVNRVVLQQNTDWLVPNSLFSPTENCNCIYLMIKTLTSDE